MKFRNGLALGIILYFIYLPSAKANRPYGMAGCGLGSVLIGSGGGQLSASTTNQSSGNQVFGITSGTSNCKTPAQMAIIIEQQEFLATNLVTLQKEMAQGAGPSLEAFVEVLGCEDSIHEQASDVLIQSYSEIFKAPGIEGVLDAAKAQLSKNEETAQNCQDVG